MILLHFVIFSYHSILTAKNISSNLFLCHNFCIVVKKKRNYLNEIVPNQFRAAPAAHFLLPRSPSEKHRSIVRPRFDS